MKRVTRLLVRGCIWLLTLALALLLLNAFSARRKANLEVWHTARLDEEFSAGDLPEDAPFSRYLENEDRVFAELAEKIYRAAEGGERKATSRYAPGGPSNPMAFATNWNRTFERIPEGKPRGSVLMVHGLTDSPYSFRSLAEMLHEEGFYVLGLRLPGHGTIPAALKGIRRKDWEAAVKLAARHAGAQSGGGPFLIFGYSNGGALAVKYALHALEQERLPDPDHLVLFSPAIGITRAAVFARAHELLSWIPLFEQSAWSSVHPEIDPFKYTSFPMSVGYQTHTLTRTLQRDILEARQAGRMKDLCPILTFKSLADATVHIEDAVSHLYGNLENPQSELVIFDVNQRARMNKFFRRDPGERLAYLFERTDLSYRLTRVTNEDDRSSGLVEHSRPAGSASVETRSLDMVWPPGFYSLSHVALPFPPDDPVYGYLPDADASFGMPLGRLEPRGERALLVISADFFSRLRSNPFYAYLEEQVLAVAER